MKVFSQITICEKHRYKKSQYDEAVDIHAELKANYETQKQMHLPDHGRKRFVVRELYIAMEKDGSLEIEVTFEEVEKKTTPRRKRAVNE